VRIYKYVLSIFLIPVFLVLLSSCKPSQAILNSTASDSLSASLSTYLTSSPVNLNEIKASFYKGIKYGEANDDVFVKSGLTLSFNRINISTELFLLNIHILWQAAGIFVCH
jgi:hypothetical protein